MKKIRELYIKYKEIINYLIVGVLTTVVTLAIYYISVNTFLNPEDSIQLQIANIISWIAGVIFAYFTNRKYVFESKEKNKLKEASKFVVSRIATLLMDMIIMWLGVTILHRNDKIMKLISQVVVIVANYLFSKIFVFKKKTKIKLLFAANSLDVGGIEKALVTLVNKLDEMGYNVTVALEKKQGIFLEELNENINIIEYKPSSNENIFIRKIINLFKRIIFIVKYKNKYDFSASFATYSIPASFMSRVASENCCLWGHADYLTLFDNDVTKFKKFFEDIKYDEFKHFVFVSKEGRASFLKIFPQKEKETITLNNLINYKKIEKLSNCKIEMKKNEKVITFLNVGRHDEKQKKLTRIIEASKLLEKDNLNFQVLFVGDGPDNEIYKDIVKKEGLESKIIFLGAKSNPYPYFKISDCVVLSSEYEGYPVVFLESFVMNKPIITTKVSDYEEVDGVFGYAVEKNAKDIYEKMKDFIENGYIIKEKFDAKKYNEHILKSLKSIF